MGVSVSGGTGRSMATLRTVFAVVGAASAVAFYFYGPLVTPLMHAAAVSSCNEHAGGDFRSYRLSWHVGTRPHWTCWDARDPVKPAVDLGWWVAGR